MGEALALGLRSFAGKSISMRHDRRQGCRRLVLPDAVERVAFDCAQAGASLFGGGAKAFDFIGRVQPGIVAQGLARF